METARSIAGKYVLAKAVDYMLVLATSVRNKRDNDYDLVTLQEQQELRGLVLTAGDIAFRGQKGPSAALVACLRNKVVTTPGFRFIVEYGPPTMEHMLGSRSSTSTHLHIHTSTHPCIYTSTPAGHWDYQTMSRTFWLVSHLGSSMELSN